MKKTAFSLLLLMAFMAAGVPSAFAQTATVPGDLSSGGWYAGLSGGTSFGQATFRSITESKKMLSGPQDMPQVNFEKHKIFLFREDFSKFEEALQDAFKFVSGEQGEAPEREDSRPEDGQDADPIKLDLDF